MILIIERLPLRVRLNSAKNLGSMDALKIGVAQTYSLFPGVSRAGATIMGGLLAVLSRTTTTEYSFLLAMPVLIVATFYELFKNLNRLYAEGILMLAVGFVMSIVIALIVVKTLLRFVTRHDFTSFALYRIDLGLLVLA